MWTKYTIQKSLLAPWTQTSLDFWIETSHKENSLLNVDWWFLHSLKKLLMTWSCCHYHKKPLILKNLPTMPSSQWCSHTHLWNNTQDMTFSVKIQHPILDLLTITKCWWIYFLNKCLCNTTSFILRRLEH